MSNTNNTVPQELIEQWKKEAEARWHSTSNDDPRKAYVKGRKDQYLSSLSSNTVEVDKTDLLAKIIVEWNNHDISWDKFIKLPQVKKMLQSLFSPAQPTEDKTADYVRMRHFLSKVVDGDGTIVSEHALNQEQLDNAYVESRVYSYQEDHALVFMPAKEPAQPLEPTEDIKDLT